MTPKQRPCKLNTNVLGVVAGIVAWLISRQSVPFRILQVPHRFNAARRDETPKQKHRVTNWTNYNEGLRRRGDLTIEMCQTVSMVFKQPLRQTQGLMRSVTRLLGVELAVPDASTLSRRGISLTGITKSTGQAASTNHANERRSQASRSPADTLKWRPWCSGQSRHLCRLCQSPPR